MSVARKCDRCKKTFDPYNMEGACCKFRNPMFQTSKDLCEITSREYLMKDMSPDDYVDLCPNCSMQLRAFMD